MRFWRQRSQIRNRCSSLDGSALRRDLATAAFSVAGLTRAASPQVDQPSRIQVVRLEEVSNAIPVLPIRSDGLIRYVGQSKTTFTASGKSWHPKVYELTASPVRKMQILTSPEGLLLTAERPGWPKGKMELVRFAQFADF
jgi:hypothetical protein